MNSPISGDCCMACESDLLTELGADAYLCDACGYEGGPGYAAYLKRKKRDRLDSMDEAASTKHTKKLLVNARLILLAVSGTLQQVKSLGTSDLLGGASGGEDGEKYQEFVSALGEVLQAQTMMEDAAYALEIPFPENLKFREELGFASSTIDMHMDNIFSDMAFIKKAKRSIGTVEDMTAWCEEQSALLR